MALTTHVLDTAQGVPGAGIVVELYWVGDEDTELVTSFETNDDGRADGPIIDDDELRSGVWELVFFVGDYFEGQGFEQSDPPFLDEVTVRFGIEDLDEDYHVPLLVSPWSYSTYRGS